MPGVRRTRLTWVVLGAATFSLFACSSNSGSRDKQVQQTAGPTCNQDAARGMLTLMSDPRMAKITEENERVVVRFGNDYTKLTPAQREALTINFAAADSCLHEQVRMIEFQTPTGEVIATRNSTGVPKAL